MRRYLIAVTAGAMFLKGCNHANSTLPQPAGDFMPNQAHAHVSTENPPKHYHHLNGDQAELPDLQSGRRIRAA